MSQTGQVRDHVCPGVGQHRHRWIGATDESIPGIPVLAGYEAHFEPGQWLVRPPQPHCQSGGGAMVGLVVQAARAP